MLACIAILANSVLRYFHAHMIIGGADHPMPPWSPMPERRLHESVFTCNKGKIRMEKDTKKPQRWRTR